MITEFKDKYRWLSNFEPCKIKFGEYEYPSVEHAYMSFKRDDPEWRKTCSNPDITAGQIKRMSRTITLREDWEKIKFDVMKECLMKKFMEMPFHDLLLETGDQNIQEGNWWGDTTWGIDLKVNPNVGENHLGRLIMEVRKELIEMKNNAPSFAPIPTVQ